MSGFPTLKPFATLSAVIEPPRSIGTLSTGGSQTFVGIASATLATETGVTPALNAEVTMGGDWIYADPDGKHLRLDVHSLFKTADDVFITLTYKGIINITEAVGKVFAGAADAKTTEFGDAVVAPVFQTGHEQYKHLENKMFVGSGRFVVGKNGVTVEYKFSEVIG